MVAVQVATQIAVEVVPVPAQRADKLVCHGLSLTFGLLNLYPS
jgi:hypothetical protein